MALASNTRYQLSNRLKADLLLRFPGYTVAQSIAAGTGLVDSGDYLLALTNSSATIVALLAVSRRHYSGFNVVAELSSSAAEGLPEHIVYSLVLTTAGQLVTSQVMMTAAQMGASSIVFGFNATMTEVTMSATNMPNEYVNSARSGASGQ